jgi:hypothetical protein
LQPFAAEPLSLPVVEHARPSSRGKQLKRKHVRSIDPLRKRIADSLAMYGQIVAAADRKDANRLREGINSVGPQELLSAFLNYADNDISHLIFWQNSSEPIGSVSSRLTHFISIP